MIKLVILSLLISLGCVHDAPVAAPAPAPNRAIVIISTLDKDAKCMDLKRPGDVEDSALCLTGGSLLWLSASGSRFEHQTLMAPPKPTAQPAPLAPPAEAPKP